MSTYIISDIHGCYNEYKKLLEKIAFSEKDELFILGDVIDRGREPLKVLRDIMNRPNVFLIKGNHEHMFLSVLEYLGAEITDESIASLDENVIALYTAWTNPRNGGDITLKEFLACLEEEREDIRLYLEEASDYELVESNDKMYILVHAGIDNFSPEKELDEYETRDFLWGKTDYAKRYFPSEKVFLVTGHTPTALIREDEKALVYEENGHIAIDCGCCFGGRMAAYCVETGEAFYVESEKFQDGF